MSHVDTQWTRLASRTARGLLARKDVSYDELAKRLCALGLEESARGVEGKIQRGSFRCSFFLQLLTALNADIPDPLVLHFAPDRTLETVSTAIVVHAISVRKLDFNSLCKRLAILGVTHDAATLKQQVESGNFSFALLLQLCLVAPIEGIERFVDFTDICLAASPD